MMKLLKYEFRKTLFPKLVLLGLTVLAEIIFLVGHFGDKEDTMATGVVLLTMLALTGLTLMGIMSVVCLHRDMNTKQGYMLFMTPNSCYKILGAKVLECGVSLLLAGAFYFALGVIDLDMVLRREGYGQIWDMFRKMLESMDERLSISVPNMMALVCYMISTWLCTVTTAYLADVICSSLLNGKKGSLFITFLLFLALQYVINRVIALLPAMQTVQAEFLVDAAAALGFAGLMYWITAWMMEKYLSV